MSKELPFFKFDPTEWLIGRISFQPVDVQGAFTQACCMYWKLGGKMKDSDIDFRIGKENLSKLKELGFIKNNDGQLYISFLDNQLEECEKMREQMRILGRNGGIKKAANRNSSETIADGTKIVANGSSSLSVPLASKSKSKSKSKERKEEKEKNNFPPSLHEVINYFKENGFTEYSAKKAYQYYNEANWIDSKGNKVLSWKQKMISVWFKEENKEKEPIRINGNKVWTKDEVDSLFGDK